MSEQLRAAVKRALDDHLSRVASSEPFTAAQYRRHGMEAREILRDALNAELAGLAELDDSHYVHGPMGTVTYVPRTSQIEDPSDG